MQALRQVLPRPSLVGKAREGERLLQDFCLWGVQQGLYGGQQPCGAHEEPHLCLWRVRQGFQPGWGLKVPQDPHGSQTLCVQRRHSSKLATWWNTKGATLVINIFCDVYGWRSEAFCLVLVVWNSLKRHTETTLFAPSHQIHSSFLSPRSFCFLFFFLVLLRSNFIGWNLILLLVHIESMFK